MNKELIKESLRDALSLLNNEFDSVSMPELGEDYIRVMGKIELALKEIEDNG